MVDHAREVILMGEEMPTCPTCGQRLEVDYDIPVDMDGDGAIWRAKCPTHGNFLVQDEPDPD